MILVPQFRSVTLRRNGDNVLVIEDGRIVFSANYKAAIEIAQAIIQQARVIEEEHKAYEIAVDQAILMNAGVPISLTGNPEIIDEARKIAKHGKHVKDVKPIGGINDSKVGTPTIRMEKK